MTGIAIIAALTGLTIGPMVPQVTAKAPAQADVEAPKLLGQCMAMKTTGEDRILVARWMLVAMASAPQMTDVRTITPGQKEKLDRGMAALFTRLLVRDCPDQSRAVFKLEDDAAFQVAGESLGEVAIKELLTNPEAMAALEKYAEYIDEKDFEAVTGNKTDSEAKR